MKDLKLSNNTAKLHQMFGKKLYANKYSFISELCQNAVDSHRMAGQTEPVVVGVKKDPNDFNDWIFYVKDYGLSFENKEDFEAKVCTLLESGKDENKTNDEDCPMGMHGIGSISVSAYQPIWKYTVVKNGTMFTSTLQEVEGRGLVHDESEYESTQEPTGVTVEVKLQRGDLSYFLREMTSKLAYFKDILFEFDKSVVSSYKALLTLNTEFKLLQSDDFQISTLSNHSEMHISLDQYSYPIKWNVLGIPPIPLNVALKFGMGDGLTADITRENLIHSPEYKEIVREKIEKVATWFTEKYNATIQDEYTELESMLKVYHGAKEVYISEVGKKYNISELLKYTQTPYKRIKFQGVSDDVLHAFITKTGNGSNGFTGVHQINKSGSKTKFESDSVDYVLSRTGFKDNNFLIDPKKGIPTKIMAYLKKTKKGVAKFWRRSDFKLFVKNKPQKVGWSPRVFSYGDLLNLKGSKVHMAQLYKGAGINTWREKIKQFQILQTAAEDMYFTRIENVVIPKDLVIEEKVRKSRSNKTKIEVGIKYPTISNGGKYYAKYAETVVELKDLNKIPKFHIYGTEEDRKNLDALFSMMYTGKLKHIVPVMMNTTSIKKLSKAENLHNFMSIEEFLKGKNQVFRRLMTGYIIHSELKSKYLSIFSQKDIIRNNLSRTFAEDLDKLDAYILQHNANIYFRESNNPLIKELVQMTHDYKLYDTSIWDVYQKVSKDIDKFDFIDFFAPTIHNVSMYNESLRNKALRAMDDCARHRKIRMHWEYYNILEE